VNPFDSDAWYEAAGHGALATLLVIAAINICEYARKQTKTAGKPSGKLELYAWAAFLLACAWYTAQAPK
jgi:hypothetical protein